MTGRFSSIHSKVWLCVLTALAAFFISVLVGFYTNVAQYNRLSNLQENYWPLVTSSDKMLTVIEQQAKKYEDAFLLGEQDLARQAVNMQVKFLGYMDNLILWVQQIDNSPVTVKSLLNLKHDYIVAMRTAKQLWPTINLASLTFEQQQRIQQFGLLQTDLQTRVEEISVALNSATVKVIQQNKRDALMHLVALTALFLLGLFAARYTVNRVSSSLLVNPLSQVLQNVRQMEEGRSLETPPISDPRDEIGQLATAFWRMAEKLKRTTVSKRYVDNVINNMSGGLVVLKPDLSIDKVSQQTLKLFDYSEADLIGQPVDILNAPGTETILSPSRIDVLLGKEVIKEVEMTCIGRDGRTFPARFSGSAMYDSNNTLQGFIGIFTDITQLKKAQDELLKMAHHDALTGLPNRNLLFDRLDHTLQDAQRHNRIFALLYLDLDKFKEINDKLGHAAGDEVLKEVSNRLQKLLRSDDTVARMGGDEFLIILNALQSPADASSLADKIVEEVKKPFIFETFEHQLGVSVGLSLYPQDGKTIDTLLKKSDAAMYVAKHSGGSRFNCA